MSSTGAVVESENHPDLFGPTTVLSLFSTVAILAVAYGLSLRALAPITPRSLRILFIWHAFDALIHFVLEGSFLYHCFFSSLPLAAVDDPANLYPDPYNFLGYTDHVHGSQAGGDNFFAQLWLEYAKADRRWAGVDLSVVSLELLTVLVVGPMACWVCYDIASRNTRANITMIILATAELYGGFITFCPEWLTGSLNLDNGNFMYLWLYLVFFNMLWVFIPLYSIYHASHEISGAFRAQAAQHSLKKQG